MNDSPQRKPWSAPTLRALHVSLDTAYGAASGVDFESGEFPDD